MITVPEFYSIFQKSHNIVIDSRKISPKDIFFAFSGKNFNAAVQAEEAINAGASAVIVEDEKYAQPEKNIFYVPSTLGFLQDLAKYHRQQLNIPIIALTGSNGKTTTKELMHAVLSAKFNTQYTQGNLNNHIGVPLTVLSIRPEHEVALVEMGANHQGEIAELCTIAQPVIGYITNFGKAHLEGFGGTEGVIKGKQELYKYLQKSGGMMLLNLDDELQKPFAESYDKVFTFGTQDADFQYKNITDQAFAGLNAEGKIIKSQLTGDYNTTNIAAALALGKYFQVSGEKSAHAIENYHPSNMRSQLEPRGDFHLIIDAYNANPSSTEASLKNFAKFGGPKMAILGDMLELGAASSQEHRQILSLANALGLEKIITVGPQYQSVNENKASAFSDAAALKEYLQANPLPVGNVLLKGSRGIALEQLIPLL